jgi:serine/threonine protein kinase
MSKSRPKDLDNGRIKLEKKLGAGCFGEVHKGKDTQTDQPVAIKLEQKSAKTAPQLEHEDKMLKTFRGTGEAVQGMAESFYFGPDPAGLWNCLVMELLGLSLEDRVQKCGGKLEAVTSALIAEQVIQRIEFLHSKGFVHRDIKPENFMFGNGFKIHHVYVIDFGLSKIYWLQDKNMHCPMKQKLSLTGTARYASINAHKGYEQSRRDDLEAIGHMFLYFLRGALPWSGLEAKTQEEKYRKICAKKENTDIGELCQGHPPQFADYLRAARGLDFTTRPDYDNYYGLMKQVRKDAQDYDYQWRKEFEKDVSGLVGVWPRINFPVEGDRKGGPKQPDDQDGKAAGSGQKGCCVIS